MGALKRDTPEVSGCVLKYGNYSPHCGFKYGPKVFINWIHLLFQLKRERASAVTPSLPAEGVLLVVV
jgi:hypothetical protein